MKQKVVVTGGAGFIGSNVVDELIERGYEVHIIDNLSAGKKENVNLQAILHVADIRNLEEIRPLLKDAHFVFHLAALPQVQGSIDHPIETDEVNVRGTLNVLVASSEAKVRKLVFSASSAAYGDQPVLPLVETMPVSPKSPYALHKYAGEEYMKLWSMVYGLPTVSLRYFNVYGTRQSADGAYPLLIARFIDLKSQGKPLTIVGTGSQTRDFVHVKDVARANVLAALSQNTGKGEVVNIGSGESYSVSQIAAIVGGPVEYLPPRIEPQNTLADISLAKKLLDWQSEIFLEEGIKSLLPR